MSWIVLYRVSCLYSYLIQGIDTVYLNEISHVQTPFRRNHGTVERRARACFKIPPSAALTSRNCLVTAADIARRTGESLAVSPTLSMRNVRFSWSLHSSNACAGRRDIVDFAFDSIVAVASTALTVCLRVNCFGLNLSLIHEKAVCFA